MNVEHEYDASFICTYKEHDDDDLYRLQFLQAFKMERWNDRIVREKIEQLYSIMNTPLNHMIDKIQKHKNILSHMLLFLGNDPDKVDVFQCLFCADTFQETHRCIIDIIQYGELNPVNYAQLDKILFIN